MIGRGLAILLLLAGACDQADSGPYLEFSGGGFIFNYRNAEAYYGFVARVLRRLPPGSVLEAEFEDPAGGPPIVRRLPARPGMVSYKFETPPLTGIRKGRDYRVELRLLESAAGGRLLASYGRSFRSSTDQELLPEAPLAVGPGYHRPDGSTALPSRDAGTGTAHD